MPGGQITPVYISVAQVPKQPFKVRTWYCQGQAHIHKNLLQGSCAARNHAACLRVQQRLLCDCVPLAQPAYAQICSGVSAVQRSSTTQQLASPYHTQVSTPVMCQEACRIETGQCCSASLACTSAQASLGVEHGLQPATPSFLEHAAQPADTYQFAEGCRRNCMPALVHDSADLVVRRSANSCTH